jgi:hypothetical protein
MNTLLAKKLLLLLILGIVHNSVAVALKLYDFVVNRTETYEEDVFRFDIPEHITSETEVQRISYSKTSDYFFNVKLYRKFSNLLNSLDYYSLLKEDWFFFNYKTASDYSIGSIIVDQNSIRLVTDSNRSLMLVLKSTFMKHFNDDSNQTLTHEQHSVLKLNELFRREFSDSTWINVGALSDNRHHCLSIITPSDDDETLQVVLIKMSNEVWSFLKSQ